MNRDAYTQLGKLLDEHHSSQLSTQLSVFQSVLINFANKYEEEIKLNPDFRGKFTKMCQLIGIDSLELLLLNSRTNENFYIGLSVRIVEICQETRDLNGGFISYKELISILKSNTNIELDVSVNDIDSALKVLDTLGKNGYTSLLINKKKWLKFSLPVNTISNDQKKVYDLCEFMGGYITYKLLVDNFDWDKVRCKSVIDDMIMNGLLWVDSQGNKGEWLYWEPSWISN